MRIWPVQLLGVVSRCASQGFILPRRFCYQFTDCRGMKGLVGLSGKSEPGSLYRVHPTAGPFPDCASTRLPIHVPRQKSVPVPDV